MIAEKIELLKKQQQELANMSGLQLVSNAVRVVELVATVVDAIETLDNQVGELQQQYTQLLEDSKSWQQKNPSATCSAPCATSQMEK